MGRQVRIACLGDGRDWVVRLACLCIKLGREDDSFEFMIDSSADAKAAHRAAVCVEMLWNDLPNMALAHLSDQRHVLLLGADLVVDFSAAEGEKDSDEKDAGADKNAAAGIADKNAAADNGSADKNATGNGSVDKDAASSADKGPAAESADADEPTPAKVAPRIDDWANPAPRGTGRGPRAPRLTAEEERRELKLDMSLLCPRAVTVRAPLDASFDEVMGEALSRALKTAEERPRRDVRVHPFFRD